MTESSRGLVGIRIVVLETQYPNPSSAGISSDLFLPSPIPRPTTRKSSRLRRCSHSTMDNAPAPLSDVFPKKAIDKNQDSNCQSRWGTVNWPKDKSRDQHSLMVPSPAYRISRRPYGIYAVGGCGARVIAHSSPLELNLAVLLHQLTDGNASILDYLAIQLFKLRCAFPDAVSAHYFHHLAI